ncbi:sensor domain-containing diguanylate cyclase [Marinobacter bohaiensis]|uniref:sensor domain-containing diguanylate cyclase n=1 Tax=Marinobacter bohaiensis TaxID=2201898 RepID=UPI000DAE3AD0|nr:diguanylate cyclase [Marinobacter bohaiensis]
MLRWLLFIVFLSGLTGPASMLRADPLVLTPFGDQIGLSPHVSYLAEGDEERSLQAIMTLPDRDWAANTEDDVNLGYRDHAYWFRLTLENPQLVELHKILEIAYPVLDSVEIYRIDDGAVGQSWTLGDKQPFNARPIRHRNFLVPLDLPPQSETRLYLRVETASSVQLPMTLWSRDAFFVAEQPHLLLEGLYYGVVLVMILYNLFVFVVVRERSFLYYVGYISAMPLFLASLHGMAFQYLWPESTWWNDHAILFFLNLTVFFGGIFAMRFLTVLPHTHPKLAWTTVTVVIASGVFALVSLAVPYRLMILPSIVLAASGCAGMVLLGSIRWYEKDPAARYFGIAWFFMLFGGVVLALNKFTLLPQNVFTENATQVGSGLGVILLSIALADRINKEKKRAFDAQERLYHEERKVRLAQEKSLAVQQEANALLEQRVQERTQDLEDLNRRLQELSETDNLTGLKNRGFFDRSFRSACVRAYRFGQPLALLVIDIDHFKRFNDRYGHLVGDDCLQMVAQCIRRFVTRPEDLAARYGGEEFVVLLPETPANGAEQVAERIREAIAGTDFRISNEVLNVTVSIGLCCVVPEHVEATKLIFHAADEALYDAKGRGRNRVTVCDSRFSTPVHSL